MHQKHWHSSLTLPASLLIPCVLWTWQCLLLQYTVLFQIYLICPESVPWLYLHIHILNIHPNWCTYSRNTSKWSVTFLHIRSGSISSFVDHRTPQQLLNSVLQNKSSHAPHINAQVWLCSNKTLFIKTVTVIQQHCLPCPKLIFTWDPLCLHPTTTGTITQKPRWAFAPHCFSEQFIWCLASAHEFVNYLWT